MTGAGTVLPNNPFPGLRPFREGEEALFFGREAQVDAMVDKLAATRFLAVVGTSGSGKSSLVNCGLLPALYRGLMAGAGSVWRVAAFSPGNQPVRALAHALAGRRALGLQEDNDSGFSPGELMEAILGMSNLGIVDAFEQAHLDSKQNLLIVVDQFEELFRYEALASVTGDAAHVSERAMAFVSLLQEVGSHHDLPIYVVLTMRSDFLGDCAQFYRLPEAINRGQYLVPRMNRDERRLAIAGPASVAGGEIEPVLLTRLVNDVGDNPDQLSILQHALNRTWAKWETEGRTGAVSLRQYEAVGTMAQALNQHAEEAFNALPDARAQAVAERLFKAITDKTTDPRGTRRPTRVDMLGEITGATSAELTDVIDVFRDPSRSFLKPGAGVRLAADTPIDISHESLMRVWDRLRKWVDEEARSAQTYRRLAETASLHSAGDADLLRQPELEFALRWKVQQRPNAAWAERYRAGLDNVLKFLNTSEHAFQEKQQQEQRLEEERRRVRLIKIWGVPGAVLFAAVVSVIVYSYLRTNLAERSATVATSLGEASNILTKLESDPTKSAREVSVDLERARVFLGQGLAVSPNSAQLRRLEAERLRVSGDLPGAIVYCLRAIQDIPNNSLLYGELGYLYGSSNQNDKAVEAFEKSIAVNSDPGAVAVSYTNLAEIFTDRKDYNRAKEAFRKALGTGRDRPSLCRRIIDHVGSIEAFSDMQADIQKFCS
jgi:tetratricopeptide (TPR) repeat protein